MNKAASSRESGSRRSLRSQQESRFENESGHSLRGQRNWGDFGPLAFEQTDHAWTGATVQGFSSFVGRDGRFECHAQA